MNSTSERSIDSDATANAVDENAANGHRRWRDRTGSRRRCHQQHDHLHAGR